MRRTIKGAAALAALCAGAMAFSTAAFAAPISGAAVVKSDSTGDVYIARLAGADRIQTSNEALESVKKAQDSVDNVFIVGQLHTVDALTLAPLAAKQGKKAAVVFTRPDSLAEGTVTDLIADAANAKYYIIGGPTAVSYSVDQQVGSKISAFRATNGSDSVSSTSVYRFDGVDRFDTAYQVGAAVVDPTHVLPANEKLETAHILKADLDLALALQKKADAEAVKAGNDARTAQDALDAANKKLADTVVVPVDDAKYLTAKGEYIKAYNAWKAADAEDPTPSNLGALKADKDAAALALAPFIKTDVDYTASLEAVAKAQAIVDSANKAKVKADKDKADAEQVLTIAQGNLASAAKNGAAVGIGSTQAYINNMKDTYDKAVKAAWESYTGGIFIAQGMDFADALTAGPAAAVGAGMTTPQPLLLTNGSVLAPKTKWVFDNVAKLGDVTAIGGPAAAAYPAATPVVGADRYETAAKIAEKYFLTNTSAKGTYALASGTVGADAVVAGVYNVSQGFAGILLTKPNSLPTATYNYIAYADKQTANAVPVGALVVFGGTQAISTNVASESAWNALLDN